MGCHLNLKLAASCLVGVTSEELLVRAGGLSFIADAFFSMQSSACHRDSTSTHCVHLRSCAAAEAAWAHGGLAIRPRRSARGAPADTGRRPEKEVLPVGLPGELREDEEVGDCCGTNRSDCNFSDDETAIAHPFWSAGRARGVSTSISRCKSVSLSPSYVLTEPGLDVQTVLLMLMFLSSAL